MPYFLLILTTLFWSGNFVLSRGMHADIPPFSLSFWRWAVALLILLSFGIRHLWVQRQIALKHFRFITIQGLLGVAAFNSLIYMAIQTTTAINAVLVNSCIPGADSCILLDSIQGNDESKTMARSIGISVRGIADHHPGRNGTFAGNAF
jgi:hypothetical protein